LVGPAERTDTRPKRKEPAYFSAKTNYFLYSICFGLPKRETKTFEFHPSRAIRFGFHLIKKIVKMIFSVSRQQATELAILVSFAVFTVACAGFFEKNETGMTNESSEGLETVSSKCDIGLHWI